MNHEERHAYVRGIMAACLSLRTPEERVVSICRELGVGPDELIDLRNEELGHGKRRKDEHEEAQTGR